MGDNDEARTGHGCTSGSLPEASLTQGHWEPLGTPRTPLPQTETGVSSTRCPLWKRSLDLAFISVSAPIWAPLMAAIAVGIKWVDRGPVFFKQERIGFRGDRFVCFKFRSMKQNAETQSHEGYLEHLIKSDRPMTKLDAKGDPRLIPFGRLLRATGLDELPQIFNVVRGEMSIVGPRPCTAKEYEYYTASERLRLDTLPGLTGYWQVNGKNKTTFSQMIALDVHYVKNRNILMDLLIILKTFPTLANQVLERSTSSKGAQ